MYDLLSVVYGIQIDILFKISNDLRKFSNRTYITLSNNLLMLEKKWNWSAVFTVCLVALFEDRTDSCYFIQIRENAFFKRHVYNRDQWVH